jgi:hypothetical protein
MFMPLIQRVLCVRHENKRNRYQNDLEYANKSTHTDGKQCIVCTMKHQLGIAALLASILLTTAQAASATVSIGQSTPAIVLEKLPVIISSEASKDPALIVNYAGLPDDWLWNEFARAAPKDLLSGLGKTYVPVIWAELAGHGHERYCYATAWVAPASHPRLPRIASGRQEHLIAIPRDQSDADQECLAQASSKVLTALAQTPWSVLKLAADETEQGRGRDPRLDSPGAGRINVAAIGPAQLRVASTNAVTEELRAANFGALYDYRERQVVVVHAQFRTETAALCIALGGLTTAPPAHFASRLPLTPVAAMASRELAGLDKTAQTQQLAACAAEAARQVANATANRAQKADGLLVSQEVDGDVSRPKKRR